jgi:integrase
MFARACLHLLRENNPSLDTQGRLQADEFLRRVMLAGDNPTALEGEDALWDEWFSKWSLPIRQITDRHLRDLLAWIRDEAPDGTRRPAAPATLNRARGALRAAFTQARKQRLIDWDPWDAVPVEPTPDHEKVDPDLVMDPAEIWLLADECGRTKARHRAKARYRAFVLLQGVCGLRPGEAIELRRRDLNLIEGAAHVTVRGSYTSIPSRFLAEGEGRRRPLKGRGPKATRTVPVPTQLVVVLRWHLDVFVSSRADSVVFTSANGGRIHPSNFRRDVWYPARAAVFDETSPLRQVRVHDLRHSAITTWLNAGVPLKTAQLWSGHKSVSVLLNTYLGVMKGDEAAARQRLEAAIEPDSVTGS